MGRTKIAVIGGGVGAITTVYAMTRDPSWRERYDIYPPSTVFSVEPGTSSKTA
jgi:hypothetical protein